MEHHIFEKCFFLMSTAYSNRWFARFLNFQRCLCKFWKFIFPNHLGSRDMTIEDRVVIHVCSNIPYEKLLQTKSHLAPEKCPRSKGDDEPFLFGLVSAYFQSFFLLLVSGRLSISSCTTCIRNYPP